MPYQFTEMRFGSFFCGEFTNIVVINPPKRKLAKHTSARLFTGQLTLCQPGGGQIIPNTLLRCWNWHPYFFPDQLIQFQPGRVDSAHLFNTGNPQIFHLLVSLHYTLHKCLPKFLNLLIVFPTGKSNRFLKLCIIKHHLIPFLCVRCI